MKKSWTTMKSIIESYGKHDDIFLSLIDEKGRIYCANANMVKTLHLQNPRDLDVNFNDLLQPNHLEEFRKAIHQCGENKTTYSTELHLKNGYVHPMKWQFTPMDDSTFTNPTFLCVGHKLPENGLFEPFTEPDPAIPNKGLTEMPGISKEGVLPMENIEHEAMFRAFMNQTPNLAWVVDKDARLIFASKAFYRYFRLDEGASANKSILELIPRSVADAMYERHKQVLNTGVPIQMVDKVQWADGTTFVFHINIFPIEGLENKTLVGGHAVNLADKYKAEHQLQQANDRLLHLTRISSDAIWEWDMQTGHIFRNEALMEMIGYHLENPKGLSWWLRRIHPEDRNRVSDKVKDASEKNLQTWEDDYRFKCADGEYKHIFDKGYIVYENGLPVKMIGSLQDVSEVKQLQGELLEEKLQRQKEISETVIRVQEKERNRIGLELHDNINQILSTTKLFVEMLTPSTKDQKIIKLKSLEYLMMSIEEIRKLSKELVVPQLKGDGLVGSIKDLINDIHFGNAIRIKFTHDHENDLLSPGKKVTLFRIVQEQFKNILKYSKAKQVEVLLQCKDNKAALIIKDDGIGFDPEQTARGIGLANIYERTRFYNGTAEIKTAPGKGCMLTISIPALD